MNTFERVRKIAAEAAYVSETQVTLRSRLGRDLGMDSLAFVEFIMSLEEELEPEVPEESVQQFTAAWQDITIQQIVDWIDRTTELS